MSWDTDYPDPLLDLQDQIRDRLESRAFFSSISVLSERPKTIGGRVEKLTAKYEGIYVAVLTVEGRATDDYLKGPESQVSVDVSACELTKTNRGGVVTLALDAAGTGYAQGDTITLAGGVFTTACTLSVSTTKVVAASLVSAGGGFPPTGIPSFTGMTGTTGAGTKVILRVGVGADGVIGSVSVSGFGTNSGGSYTENPTNLSAEPLTHASLLGAPPTVSLTMGVATFVISGAGSYTGTGATAFTQGSTSGGGTGATFNGTTYVTATRVLTQIIRALHSFKPTISTEKLKYQGFRVDEADQSTGVLILTARFNAVIRFPADLT
jgi:hypothetical protein